MALWEVLAARRELRHPRRQRWLANLGIAVIDSLVVGELAVEIDSNLIAPFG